MSSAAAHYVVEHARGDDVVGVAAVAQELRDLERVQDERRVVGVAALVAVALGGVLQRVAGQRQLGDEAGEPRGGGHRAPGYKPRAPPRLCSGGK